MKHFRLSLLGALLLLHGCDDAEPEDDPVCELGLEGCECWYDDPDIDQDGDGDDFDEQPASLNEEGCEDELVCFGGDLSPYLPGVCEQ